MIMNIVSEVAIVGLEVAIMIPLQLALKKKLSIIALFLGRILYARVRRTWRPCVVLTMR